MSILLMPLTLCWMLVSDFYGVLLECLLELLVVANDSMYLVPGALNAVTKKLVTVTNDTYITSTQVCEMLKKLAKNATLPITLVLDNARYQRCQMVMQLAQELGMELLSLPPYSPNLNLIERLWKLLKKERLNCVYYENFSFFKGAIQGFLTNITKIQRKKTRFAAYA